MKGFKTKLLGVVMAAAVAVCLLPQAVVSAADISNALACPNTVNGAACTGTLVPHPQTSATCTKWGSHAFFQCNTCGVCYFANKVNDNWVQVADTSWVPIAPTGHTIVATDAVAATCTTSGVSANVKCSVCQTVISAPQTIPALGHQYVVTNIKTATSKKDGTITETCSICGVQQVTTIKKASTIELAQTTVTYNGSAKKPKVSVFDSDGNVVSKSEYKVTYSNNKKVGTATVTIKFKGNHYYSGTVTKTFQIVAK